MNTPETEASLSLRLAQPTGDDFIAGIEARIAGSYTDSTVIPTSFLEAEPAMASEHTQTLSDEEIISRREKAGIREKIGRRAKAYAMILALSGASVVGIRAFAPDESEGNEPAAAGSPSPAGELCPPKFVAKVQARPNSRAVEGGLKGLPAQALETLSQQVYHDPSLMEYYGEHFFKKDLADERFVNASGACLSPAGQAMAVKIDGVFDVLKLSARDSAASRSARNSGLTANGPTVADRAGLSGDLRSIKAVMPGGKTIEFLRRCGNIVGEEAPPFVPPGPTDQKKPVPLPGPFSQPDSGGQRELDGQPDDNDNDGYDRDDRSEHPRDTDGDGIYDATDQCDRARETFNGYKDRDGCPDTRPANPSPRPTTTVTATPSATPNPTATPSPPTD